jgi:hypothetical protein
LAILENEKTGSLEGTLLHLVDHCVTPFGKKLPHRADSARQKIAEEMDFSPSAASERY